MRVYGSYILKCLDSFLVPAEACKYDTLVVPCMGIFPVDGNCPVIGCNRLVITAKFRERDCPVIPAVGILGLEVEGFYQRIESGPELAEGEEGTSFIEPCTRTMLVTCKDPIKAGYGFAVPGKVKVRSAFPVPCRCIVR